MYPRCAAAGVLPCLLDFGWGVLLSGWCIVRLSCLIKHLRKTTPLGKMLFERAQFIFSRFYGVQVVVTHHHMDAKNAVMHEDSGPKLFSLWQLESKMNKDRTQSKCYHRKKKCPQQQNYSNSIIPGNSSTTSKQCHQIKTPSTYPSIG